MFRPVSRAIVRTVSNYNGYTRRTPDGVINLTQSYYQAAAPVNNAKEHALEYTSLGQAFADSVSKNPDVEALNFVLENQKFTNLEYYNATSQVAESLAKQGLKKGDRVGIWMPNLKEWPIAMMACARMGYILVPINPLYTKHEVDYVIETTQPKAIFTTPNFRGIQPYHEHLKGHDLLKIYANGSIFNSEKEVPSDGIDFDEFRNAGSTSFSDGNMVNADETAVIMFTSGTTGKPKGAMLSHFSIVNNAISIGLRADLGRIGTKTMVNVPLFHVFGLVASAALNAVWGTSQLYPAPGFDAKANLNALKEKPTDFFGTPTMFVDFIRAIDENNIDPATIGIERACMGGSLMLPELGKRVRDMGMKVTVAYGLTETTAATVGQFLEENMDDHLKTVGTLHPNLELKCIDENGQIVPVGKTGEICVRGYSVMQGYWNDEEKTKEAKDIDGWFHTGDLGIMDSRGYMQIVGRNKDMIIRGGENIFPKEIEEVLTEHEQIIDAQVVGRPCSRYGEEVAAYLLLKSTDGKIDLEEVKSHCRNKLSKFKIPKYWKVVEDYPKTISGKVKKFELRKMSETDFTN